MECKKTPIVSVFMPAYNQEHLVAESIESVLAQDFKDWELVIGDDCSTDNTFAVLESYRVKHQDKIKIIRNPVNLGITGNCNVILRNCAGKYIAIMGGDDLLLYNKLSKQVVLMEANPDCVLCYHDVEVFFSDSVCESRYWNSGIYGTKAVVGTTDFVAKALVEQGTGFMEATSVMVRRNNLPKNGFDVRIPVASDWLMWIEICAQNKGKVLFIDEILARYRKHNGGITSVTNSKHFEDPFVTLALVESRYPELVTSAHYTRAQLLFGMGMRLRNESVTESDFNQSRLLLYEAIRLNPLKIYFYLHLLNSWRCKILRWFHNK